MKKKLIKKALEECKYFEKRKNKTELMEAIGYLRGIREKEEIEKKDKEEYCYYMNLAFKMKNKEIYEKQSNHH